MTTQHPSGSDIATTARTRVAEFRRVAAEVGDAPAADGEWGAREICSHILGDAQDRFIDGIRKGLELDDHVIVEIIGLSQMTSDRESMSAAQLAGAVATEYEELAGFVAGLSDEQLARTVKAPPLEPFLGSDTLPLGAWADTVLNLHLPSHVEQLAALKGA